MKTVLAVLLVCGATHPVTSQPPAQDTSPPFAFYGGPVFDGRGGLFAGLRWFEAGVQIAYTREEFPDAHNTPIPFGVLPEDIEHGWSDSGSWGVDFLYWFDPLGHVDLAIGPGVLIRKEAYIVEDGIAGTGEWTEDTRRNPELAAVGQAMIGLGEKRNWSLIVGYHTALGVTVGFGWRSVPP